MTLRTVYSLCGVTAAMLVVGCGSDPDMLQLAGNNQGAAAEGNALYQEAKQADDAGKTGKAIKLYDRTATRYSFIDSAPQARFRQAELLEQTGEVLKAFKAYQEFLTRFQGSGLYSTALSRQANMAQAAAEGEIKNSFLGLKTRLSVEKIVEMLGQVRDNAPKSATAAKAQFAIGELHRRDKKAAKAIEAYRQLVRDQPDSKEAPEAMFQIGVAFTEEADRGNQNMATIDLAREAFNDYLNQYPGHHRNAEARQRIAGLGGRDVERTFEIAEYYFKTGQFESAKVYYRDIAKRTSSGKLHDKSKARLHEMGE
jgi:outer membrane assembly lipoprotein YfiO